MAEVGVTCYFVSDELCRLHLAHAAEEAAQFILAHALRQVVDNQVGSRLVVLHQLLRKAVIVQILVRGGIGGGHRESDLCLGSGSAALEGRVLISSHYNYTSPKPVS